MSVLVRIIDQGVAHSEEPGAANLFLRRVGAQQLAKHTVNCISTDRVDPERREMAKLKI